MITLKSRRVRGERGRERTKDVAPVRRAEQIFTRTLRMRHQSQHVAFVITDARYLVARAVRIGIGGRLAALVAVTKDDAILARQLFQSLIVADVVAFGVCDWNAQHAS